jgi:hypothetical protein
MDYNHLNEKKRFERKKAVMAADARLQDAVSFYSRGFDPKNPDKASQLANEASLVSKAMTFTQTAAGISGTGKSDTTALFIEYFGKNKGNSERKEAFKNVDEVLKSDFAKKIVGESDEYDKGISVLDSIIANNKATSLFSKLSEAQKTAESKLVKSKFDNDIGLLNGFVEFMKDEVSKTDQSVLGASPGKVEEFVPPDEPAQAGVNDPFAGDRPAGAGPVEVAPGVVIEDEGNGDVEAVPIGAGAGPAEEAGAGAGAAEEEVKEGEGKLVPVAGGGGVVSTPVDLDELKKQRERVGQFRRSDLGDQKKGDPPLNTMAMTDAKPIVGERNMRPLLFREEGDTVELTQKQENENRIFYENFTWVDSGFGNSNIQRIPGSYYAGKDSANNRLYDAQIKNEKLKYTGRLFNGSQQYRKKYDISQQTRNLIRIPMFSTVQNHQEFIRDSSLEAGAGRPHQMARDDVSWIPRKNVNSKVGRLYYPDLVDGKRL